MNDFTAVFLALFLFGVGMPAGMLAVIGDIDTAGKTHALKVAKAEKDAAYAINGKIKMAALRADWK